MGDPANEREMSVEPDSVEHVIERWGREQVLGLAPDAASGKAAGAVARSAQWAGAGCDGQAVWGECRGSGKSAYRASVDLGVAGRSHGGETQGAAGRSQEGERPSGPAFRCSCPSRKVPCKHILGLLLLWSDGTVGEGVRPGWVGEWLAQRRERAEQARRHRDATETTGKETKGKGTETRNPKTAERREQRVDDGIAEFDRWLCDQITHGLAQAEKASYQVWDETARRLVDAQAGVLAGQVRALASIPRRGADWPGRLLEEYALLRLLTTAFRRRSELPEPLRATVRSRVGFTVSQEEVLAGDRLRDHWYVAGTRDSEQDRLLTRRVWLRGRESGRPALILSFAAPGRGLDASLVVGDTVDAELAFYPGAQPLRALVGMRYGAPDRQAPRGTTVQGLLGEYAEALSRDPWLDEWPAVLENVRPARIGEGDPHVVDQHGDALPLRVSDPWKLLAVSGGRPITVAGEWSPRGLLPLSAWHEEEGPVIF